MFAHKIETIIQEEGTLHLESLPFTKGDLVEVIILKRDATNQPELKKRTFNQYAGKIWVSEDFCDPLPDEFWFGDESS